MNGNMCGIHAAITTSSDFELPTNLKQSLVNRGPDHLGQTQRKVTHVNTGQPLRLYFTSTVLALRGDHVVNQPLEEHAGAGSVLCWNGEAWRINGQAVGGNDGEAIFSMLQSSDHDRETHVVEVMRSIEGPFAFVYYDAAARRLYYGRDRLGRRSLLIKCSVETDSITFSSVSSVPTAGWDEVATDHIWSIDLSTYGGVSSVLSFQDLIHKHRWLHAINNDMVSSGVHVQRWKLNRPGIKYRHFQQRITTAETQVGLQLAFASNSQAQTC